MVEKMRYILQRRKAKSITIFDHKKGLKDKDSLPERSSSFNNFIKNQIIYHNQMNFKYNFNKSIYEMNNFFQFLFLMIFLLQTSICKKAELNALNNDNYINLTIKGIGQQYLLSHHMPDYVEPVSTIINGLSVEVNRTHYLPKENNIVIISWDQQLTSCNLFAKHALMLKA